MVKQTPMIKQYNNIKKRYKDCIVFFRMGDFYEMFFDDAKIGAKELGIALTSRDSENRVPMAGVPHHAADTYIARLVNKGYKVAICEQLEDPATAKGIVERDVVKVITPGTITDIKALDEKKNNYLTSIYELDGFVGIASTDISTGKFIVSEFDVGKKYSNLMDEFCRLEPAECICPPNFFENKHGLLHDLKLKVKTQFNEFDDWAFGYDVAYKTLIEHFNTANLQCYGCQEMKLAIRSAGALIEYLKKTQKCGFQNIAQITTYSLSQFMLLDSSTRKNLELFNNLNDGSKNNTLIGVLDKTVTAMGGRTIRQWLEQPLLSKSEINRRLDAVEELVKTNIIRQQMRDLLKGIYDFERLTGRLALNNANARDMVALKKSLSNLPELKSVLSALSAEELKDIHDKFDTLEDIKQLLDESIDDNPPVGLKDGGIIKKGFNKDIDELRRLTAGGKEWLLNLEQSERERTGIKNLKVGFNKVFGYFIEISRSNLNSVPQDYIRKQTLVNSERFIKPELKEYEASILGAEERLKQTEYKIFEEIRAQTAIQSKRILKTAKMVGLVDVLSTLAHVALYNEYTRPKITDDTIIRLKRSRHPVVESSISSNRFVPNDVELGNNDRIFAIITGPNMAGKSTYLRQVAIISIMAQIGSFVPADEAQLCIVDRVFTRIGASDDLASGQSTFMVEMSEVANIINNATKNSLILLDEVGRGTSTYDGMSLAWAIAEYINKHIEAKTLFATHYHELTELADIYRGIHNLTVAVEEKDNEIIFLRKIVKGKTDRSYGIFVGKLAGLPEKILKRAWEILDKLEQNKYDTSTIDALRTTQKETAVSVSQLNLFDLVANPIVEELKKLDINNLTPIQALNKLHEWQKELTKRQEGVS